MNKVKSVFGVMMMFTVLSGSAYAETRNWSCGTQGRSLEISIVVDQLQPGGAPVAETALVVGGSSNRSPILLDARALALRCPGDCYAYLIGWDLAERENDPQNSAEIYLSGNGEQGETYAVISARDGFFGYSYGDRLACVEKDNAL